MQKSPGGDASALAFASDCGECRNVGILVQQDDFKLPMPHVSFAASPIDFAQIAAAA